MASDAKRWPGIKLSLRAQVALVIATLSFLPNIFMILILFVPTFGGDQLSMRVLLPLFAWVISVAVLSAGIGYVLSRQLLLPLTRLTEQINVLQRRKEKLSEVRLSVASREPKEVVSLKRSFNALLVEVNTEQTRRRSFMATLMHDLKTPLIAANHLLAVIKDTDNLSKEERIDIVSNLLRENKGLTELVQKMVDAHKFELETVPLSFEEVRFEELLARVISRVKPLAQERGIMVEMRGRAKAKADVRELERAFYNLLSNAVRYARSKIVIENFAGLVRLSDDGPGLPAPLDILAQPFNAQPIELAGQRYTAGTGGLGLFIARRIIEAHGGRLTLERTGPKGTVLLIYLGLG